MIATTMIQKGLFATTTSTEISGTDMTGMILYGHLLRGTPIIHGTDTSGDTMTPGSMILGLTDTLTSTRLIPDGECTIQATTGTTLIPIMHIGTDTTHTLLIKDVRLTGDNPFPETHTILL